MAVVSAHPVSRKAPPAESGVRTNSLRHAASAVFAVTTIVPLLIFVLTLHRIGALTAQQSQVGLGLALGVALFGFYIFRRLMGQMSDLISSLGRVVAQSARATSQTRAAAGPATAGTRRPADSPSPSPAALAHSATAPVASTAARVAPTAEPVVVLEAPAAASAAPRVPGLGAIREVDDLSHAMAKLWMGEAIAYKGRRVSLSVMNTPRPIVGTLVGLTRDGLVIDQEGSGQVAVSYARLSGIDAA